MKTCFIFLDVDGVLNNKKRLKKFYNKYHMAASCWLMPFDRHNLRALNLLYKYCKKHYNTFIVLSSTWRLGQEDRAVVASRLYEYGMPLTADIQKFCLDRGRLIRNYLSDQEYIYDRSFILDDDSFDIVDYLTRKDIFIQPDRKNGLTYRKVFHAILSDLVKRHK